MHPNEYISENISDIQLNSSQYYLNVKCSPVFSGHQTCNGNVKRSKTEESSVAQFHVWSIVYQSGSLFMR